MPAKPVDPGQDEMFDSGTTGPETKTSMREKERLRHEKWLKAALARGGTPLARLAAWAADLSADGFAAGAIVPGRMLEDGARTLAHWADSKAANTFRDCCYHDGWVKPDLNWSEWAATPHGEALLKDRAALATADRDDLSALITTILRADRFNEGYFGARLSDGTVLAICRRAEDLAALDNGA